VMMEAALPTGCFGGSRRLTQVQAAGEAGSMSRGAGEAR
jgi:hypothetical protein